MNASGAMNLRDLAEAVAREAGAMILAGTGSPEVSETKSSPTDVVTAMDTAVEHLLRTRLKEARPDDGVLGEEEGASAGASGLTWVLDPIDGTVNYLYRLPNYAVSVAVVEGDPAVPGAWRPVAACVHQPATGTTFTAAAGQGSTQDGVPLRIPTPPEPDRALIATGFGYRSERRASQARVLAGLLPGIRDIRRMGSAALDLCAVAAGTVDAYYERGVNVWDVAAATLVVTEAGGVVTGLRGAPASPEFTLAAAEPLAGRLGALLVDLEADRD